MKFLAAPWRWPFLTGIRNDRDCIFCRAPKQADEESLICFRGEKCFVLLNKYPYNSGHLMVAPFEHLPSPDPAAAGNIEMWNLALRSMDILRKHLRPDGFNVGMNIGKAAGAGIADHFHLHVVPRWEGDANFMAVTGETRVMSYDIGAVHRIVADAFRGLVPDEGGSGESPSR